MDDVVELEADLKIAMIPARRLVPRTAAPPSTRTRTVLDNDSRSSDPADIAEVNLLAEFPQHEGVQRGRCISHMQPLLGATGYERGGEERGGERLDGRGFIGINLY